MPNFALLRVANVSELQIVIIKNRK